MIVGFEQLIRLSKDQYNSVKHQWANNVNGVVVFLVMVLWKAGHFPHCNAVNEILRVCGGATQPELQRIWLVSLSLPVSPQENQYLCKPSTHSLQLCRNYSFPGFHKGPTDLLTCKHFEFIMPSMHDWEVFHVSIYRINILIIFIIFNDVQGWCQEEAITEGGVFKVTVKSHCSLEEGTHSETADVGTKIRNTSQIEK